MGRKFNKLFILLGLVVIFTLCGCSNNKYGAKMYSSSNEWVLESFLEDNKVSGAYYKNPNYVSNAADTSEEYYCDETSPKTRTFTINNKEEYNAIFIENSFDVDFNKEIVYLYIFADIYPTGKYDIDKISVEEDNMEIYFELEYNSKKYSTAPYQRCLIVVMDNISASDVVFIKK